MGRVVHGAWCMVHGAWCMVHGAWCMGARGHVLVACVGVRGGGAAEVGAGGVVLSGIDGEERGGKKWD